MLFKKLIVPMCQDYYTRDCSRLIIYKLDIKDMFFDKTNLKIILNNNLSYSIPSSTSRILLEGIRVESHVGTWYSISHKVYDGEIYFLLEHEEYGDEAANIIIDIDGYVVLEGVRNGFDDLEDYFDIQKEQSKQTKADNTINIVVQNGLIEAVYAANKELNVSIIDLDTENPSLKEYLTDEIKNLETDKYDIL